MRPRHSLGYEWAIVAATVTLIAFVLVAGSWTWKPDQVLYDLGISLQERPARKDVVVIAIDDASLSRIGPWPWSHATLAALLETVGEAKPRSVGIDLLFAEPDYRNAGDDSGLADEVSRLPNAVLSVLSLHGRELLPMQSLAQSTRVANVSVALDPDGVLRRASLDSGIAGDRKPHMALLMAQLGGIETRNFRLTDYPIPFIGPQGKVHQLSAAAVLHGEVSPSLLSNKFVLIGLTAKGLADRYTTPSTTGGSQMAEIEVTANILTGLLDGRQIRLLGNYSVGLVSAAAMLLLLLVFYRVGPNTSLTLMFATVFLTPVFAVIVLGKIGVWFPPMSAAISALIAYPLWHWKRLEAICNYLDDEIVRLESDQRKSRQVLPAGTVGFADYIQNRIELIRLNVNYLRATRKFLNESLDGLPFAALVVAPGGVLVVANNQALALCNLSRGDMDEYDVNKALARIKPEAMDWTAALNYAMCGNKLALKATDEEGSEYEVALASFRSDEGVISGLIVVLEDVTELRRAQREREDALSFLSHDIRSPQNSILALAELQRHDATRKSEGEFVTAVEALARKTTMLAEDFLQLARADSKQLALLEYDFNALVDDCIAEIEPQARARRVTIQTLERADGATVRVDRSLMARAIVNLLVNAVKHSPEGSVVQVTFSISAGEIACSIIDSGSGIQESDLPKLFQRFSRLQESNSKIPGSGLGLAFVDVVARRHEGRSHVESVIGKGATFSIVLPQCFISGD